MLCARQKAHTEHIRVLLHGGIEDLLGGAVQPCVDDVHASVAEREGDDLDAVEPDLGDDKR